MQEARRVALGLKKTDTKVLGALTNKPLSMAQLARATKLPRTTLNYRVRLLERRRLVARRQSGKRHVWTLDSHEITSAKTVYQSAALQVKLYRGVNELVGLWQEVTAPPLRKRLYAIQPDASFNLALKHILKTLPYARLAEINKRILKHKIIVDAAVHEKSANTVVATLQEQGADPAVFLEGFLGRAADTVKLPDQFMDVGVELFMYGDMLALVCWEEEVGIRIQNKDFAVFFKHMFESVKYLCARYDQNERMAQKIVELRAAAR